MAVEKSKQVSNKNMTWSTKVVDNWMQDHAEGTFHKENPWLVRKRMQRYGLFLNPPNNSVKKLCFITYFSNLLDILIIYTLLYYIGWVNTNLAPSL